MREPSPEPWDIHTKAPRSCSLGPWTFDKRTHPSGRSREALSEEPRNWLPKQSSNEPQIEAPKRHANCSTTTLNGGRERGLEIRPSPGARSVTFCSLFIILQHGPESEKRITFGDFLGGSFWIFGGRERVPENHVGIHSGSSWSPKRHPGAFFRSIRRSSHAQHLRTHRHRFLEPFVESSLTCFAAPNFSTLQQGADSGKKGHPLRFF